MALDVTYWQARQHVVRQWRAAALAKPLVVGSAGWVETLTKYLQWLRAYEIRAENRSPAEVS